MNKFEFRYENTVLSQISALAKLLVRSLDGNFERIKNTAFSRRNRESLTARGYTKSMNIWVKGVQIARGHVFGRCGEKT